MSPVCPFPKTTRKTMHMVMVMSHAGLQTVEMLWKFITEAKSERETVIWLRKLEKINQNDQLCHYWVPTDLTGIRISAFHFPSERERLFWVGPRGRSRGNTKGNLSISSQTCFWDIHGSNSKWMANSFHALCLCRHGSLSCWAYNLSLCNSKLWAEPAY